MELKGEGYIRTDLTDELHEKFNFRTDTQIVGSTKMKKIINQTKKQKKHALFGALSKPRVPCFAKVLTVFSFLNFQRQDYISIIHIVKEYYRVML